MKNIKNKIKQSITIILSILYLTACVDDPKPIGKKKTADDVPLLSYSIVNQFPHSTSSFTEGLLIQDKEIFESTGSPIELPETKSVFGILNTETGDIDVKKELDRKLYFGEGIVIFQDKIYQLTYKKQTCFVYDLETYKNIKQYRYSNKEGWGMTTDGKHIIMSDGTYNLSFRDPNNFEIVKTLPVKANYFGVQNLNELEYVNGYIYANIWPTNKVVKIDAESGHVVGKIDLTNLHQMALNKNPRSQETNGIAYDPISNTMYVTGKMWPEIYQIQLPNL